MPSGSADMEGSDPETCEVVMLGNSTRHTYMRYHGDRAL
jgi:hypothetical protein